MGLRWRWTLVLAAAAGGLVLVAGIGIESTLRARMGAEDRESRLLQSARLQSYLDHELAGLETRLTRLAADPELVPLFGTAAPTDAQLRVREDFVVLAAERGEFDELLVLDPGGRVLACSAHPDRIGSPHPEAPALLAAPRGTGPLWRERVAADPSRSTWRISAIQPAALPSGGVLLVGSLVLDEAGLRELGSAVGVGGLEWGPAQPGEEMVTWPPRILAPEDAHLAYRPAAAADIQALKALRVWLLAAVGLTLVIGIVGAPWIAAAFGRPLVEMSAAMERIGRGARTVEIEASGPPEVRQVQRALRQLVRDLRESEEKLRAAERQATSRELARHIAHEIRNVLSPLALALDNVETGVGPGSVAVGDSLAVARDQVESLRRLATEFSEHARQPEPRIGLVAVEDLVDAAAQTARAAFAGLDLVVYREDAPDTVDGDAEQLRRALHNLIKNAVEVAPGTTVQLRAGANDDGRTWWVEVADAGPGLPPEVERSLGQPQVSTREGGSGLGLAIVSAVCAAHGGRLLVARPDGGGTILRMELARQLASPASPGGRP